MEDKYKLLLNDLFPILVSFLICIVSGDSKKDMDQKVKMNGRPAKPKATKVTFEDEVMQTKKNESPVLSPTPLPNPILLVEDDDQSSDSESDSESSDSSETDQSSEDEQGESGTVTDNLVLTRDMADLMLSHLDLMNLRTLRTECTAAYLLKKYKADAQARLDVAKRMLDDIPETMSHTERKVYMLEISRYVESIFNSLESLSLKLVKCHGDSVCDAIQEFDDHVKTLEADVPKPVRRRLDKADKALRIMEVGVLFAFLVLSVFMVYLLTRPDIGTVFGGFMLSVLNGTWKSSYQNLRSIDESNSSGMDVLG